MTNLVGDLIGITAVFQNSMSADADPVSVSLAIVDPANVRTDFTSGYSHPSTGHYSHGLTLFLPGTYLFRWTASGNDVSDVQEGSVFVAGTAIPSDEPATVLPGFSVDDLTNVNRVLTSAILSVQTSDGQVRTNQDTASLLKLRAVIQSEIAQANSIRAPRFIRLTTSTGY